MGWEEISRERYPCPCGKGEYEEIFYSDDWGRSETRYVMLCPECKDKYVYDHTRVWGHPGNEVERGWVLRSQLKAEQKYRKEVEAKARELYFDKWRDCFKNARNKKEVWKILTLYGKYYPSLGTFYNHTRGYNKEQLTREINRYFNYYDLERVFEVCKAEPNWEYLGLNVEDRKRFQRGNKSNKEDVTLHNSG